MMGNIQVIIQREFNTRVRKKSFIFTTLLTPLLMAALMVVPAYLATMKTDTVREILVIDHSGVIGGNMQSSASITYRQVESTPEQIKAERPEVYGFMTIGADVMSNPGNIQLYTFGNVSAEVEGGVSKEIRRIIEAEKLKAYNIENIQDILSEIKTNVSVKSFSISDDGDDKESSGHIAMGAAYILSFMIYMFIFLYGSMVMHGVVEEKGSKVLEIMVSSVRPFDLMMGKIIGIAAVALVQFLIWVVLIAALWSVAANALFPDLAAAAAANPMAGAGAMGGVDPNMVSAIRMVTDPIFLLKILGGFVVFFIGGYLLYSAMFAAIGSAVDNVADLQQLQMPVTLPLILAIMVMMFVMREPDSSMAFWFSIIPFTSPIVMMARIPYGVPVWEMALSIVLLYGCFIGMVWVAGKIYRVGIFMYGKKPTWKELIKWINVN